MIVIGILSVMNVDFVVNFFGLFVFGDGVGNEGMFLIVWMIYEYIIEVIIVLIGIYILVVFYYFLIVCDGFIGCMLKFWKSVKV